MLIARRYARCWHSRYGAGDSTECRLAAISPHCGSQGDQGEGRL